MNSLVPSREQSNPALERTGGTAAVCHVGVAEPTSYSMRFLMRLARILPL
jgi:hypothetical protein